jgi:hypothetical protein
VAEHTNLACYFLAVLPGGILTVESVAIFAGQNIAIRRPNIAKATNGPPLLIGKGFKFYGSADNIGQLLKCHCFGLCRLAADLDSRAG